MKNRFNRATTVMRILIVGLFLVMLLATGPGLSCQSQEAAPPATTPGLPNEPNPGTPPTMLPQTEVTIEGLAFKPAEISVPVGSTVTWYNNDSVLHTVTARDNSFSSAPLSRDDIFSHTFEQSGTFEYHCTIHPYMQGKVVVE